MKITFFMSLNIEIRKKKLNSKVIINFPKIIFIQLLKLINF